MMEQRTGTFEPLPKDTQTLLREAHDAEQQRRILEKLPRPTLHVGEIVEIKGVKFEVCRIKADGKLGLKMLAIAAGPQTS